MSGKLCECCGLPILIGEMAIEIRVGKMHKTGHPHYKVAPKSVDFFHIYCDTAIREVRA